MKALVTGGTGFLGQALSQHLQQIGLDVTVVGRNFDICQQLERQHFRVIRADFTDKAAIIKACEHQDYVFHCGALSSPWGKYHDFYNANVIGTQHVIAGCFKHQVQRLVHVSTPSIYFHFKDQLLISENDPLPSQSVNAYAKTKRLAEHEIDLAYQTGLQVITLRPRGLFGPGDTAIMPRLIKAHESMPLPLFKAGKVMLDMTYIDNVVEALVCCMYAPTEALGKKFNITNDEPMYLIDLLHKLFDKLNISLRTRPMNYCISASVATALECYYKWFMSGKEPPFTRYTLGLLAKDQTLDISLAKRLLGYTPKISIDEGLDRFVASLKTAESLLCR